MEEMILQVMREHIPQAKEMNLSVLMAQGGESKVLLPNDSRWIREGGSLSGPTLFALADASIYAALLSLKPDQIGALTTQMSIQFLKRPVDQDLVGCSKILTISKRNIFGEVKIFNHKNNDLIAVATGSYSLAVNKKE